MERGLSRNAIKYIAAFTMVIDHVGMLFFPITTFPGLLCRIIGRFTAPTMCFFLAEGYEYTTSRKKYIRRLLIFAVLSQPAYALMNYGAQVLPGETAGSTIWKAFLHPDFNVLFTFLFSFLILYVYDMVPGFNRRCILMGLLLGATMFCDWGLVAPLYVLAFHIYRENRRERLKWFVIITLGALAMYVMFCIASGKNWYGQLWEAGLFLFIPVLFLYNGKKGSGAAFHKWFFYIFYPLQALILWAAVFF